MGKAHEVLISAIAKNIDQVALGPAIGVKPHGRYIQVRGKVLKIKLIQIIQVALKGDKVNKLPRRKRPGYSEERQLAIFM